MPGLDPGGDLILEVSQFLRGLFRLGKGITLPFRGLDIFHGLVAILGRLFGLGAASVLRPRLGPPGGLAFRLNLLRLFLDGKGTCPVETRARFQAEALNLLHKGRHFVREVHQGDLRGLLHFHLHFLLHRQKVHLDLL
jgi:hypothetical protein